MRLSTRHSGLPNLNGAPSDIDTIDAWHQGGNWLPESSTSWVLFYHNFCFCVRCSANYSMFHLKQAKLEGGTLWLFADTLNVMVIGVYLYFGALYEYIFRQHDAQSHTALPSSMIIHYLFPPVSFIIQESLHKLIWCSIIVIAQHQSARGA